MTDLMPIQTTARLLMSRSQAEDLTFDAEDLVLFRSDLPHFSKQSKEVLTELVRNAQRVAHANYFANVLVGPSDEGSEGGDVAIWLGIGDFGKGKEGNILTALGLPEAWIDRVRRNSNYFWASDAHLDRWNDVTS